MPKAKLDNCWTCRLRHKRCDGQRPICQACGALEVSCHYSDVKPEWMDDGKKQEAMMAKIKAEIKDQAHRRRSEKAIKRIQMSLRGTESEDPQDSAGPSRVSTSPEPKATSHSSLADLRQHGKLGFLSAYLDYVFPVIYPFYQPSPLDGGRGWIMAMIVKNQALCHVAESLTSHVLSVVPCRAELMPERCRVTAENVVDTQTSLAMRQVFADVDKLKSHNIHDRIQDSVALLNSTTQILDSERTMAASEHWKIHLEASLDLLKQLLAQPDQYYVSKWTLLLDQLARPGPEFPTWNDEQGALRFSVASLIMSDVVASTSLQRPPLLLNHYAELLSLDSTASRHAISLEGVFGCQNWVIVLLGQASAAYAWKCEASNQEKHDQFRDRLTIIERGLKDGIDRLGHAQAVSDPPFDIMTLTSRYHESPSTVTGIWAHAALIYVYVLRLGWEPLHPDIQATVARAIELFSEVSSPVCLRTLAWPFCVTACLATGSARPLIRRLIDKLGPLASLGATRVAVRIIEEVWESHPASSWDIAACINILGKDVLLC